MRDISQFNLDDLELKLSLAGFRQDPNPVFLATGSTGRLVTANPATFNVLSYTPQELTTLNLSELIIELNNQGNSHQSLDGFRELESRWFLCKVRTGTGGVISLEAKFDLIEHDDEEFFYFRSDRSNRSDLVQLSEILQPSSDGIQLTTLVSSGPGPDQQDITDAGSPVGITRLDRGPLSNTYDEIYLFETDSGKIVDANETAEKKLGYSREELLGKSVFDIQERFDSLENWRERLEELRKDDVGTTEGLHVRENGANYPVEVKSSLVNYVGREYLVCIVRDLTERKRKERDSERLFNAVHDSIVVLDPESGSVVDVNESFCEVLGYQRDEILEMGINGFSVPAMGYDQSEAERLIERLLDSDDPMEPFEWACQTASGQIRWMEVNPTSLDFKGETRILAIGRDITDRKRNLEELEFRQTLLKAQQEAAPEGILVLSPTFRILSFNDRFQSMWGVRSEVLEDGDARELLSEHEDELIESETYLDDVVELINEPTRTHQDEVRFQDGRIFEYFTGPVKTRDQFFGRVWYFRDVTEQRQVKEQLEKSLREKEILLKEIHHRVKNNLQVIVSLLSMQDRNFQSPGLHKAFQDSIDRVKTMALVHENLYQSDEIGDVEFEEYLTELCSYLTRTIGKNDSIIVNIMVEDRDLQLDQAIACGLIVNELVTNALEHGIGTDRDGRIEIKFVVDDEDRARLSVSDSGDGLSGSDLESVSSTGLNIVQSLVKIDLDGDLTIDRGKGFTVTVAFDL